MRRLFSQLASRRTHRLRERLMWHTMRTQQEKEAKTTTTVSPDCEDCSRLLNSSTGEQDEEDKYDHKSEQGSKAKGLGGPGSSTNNNGTSCLRICVFTGLLVTLVCTVLVLGREYIVFILMYIEKTNLWVSFGIFCLLYTIVAFPMTWGYILLNIAAGYLYGGLLGIATVLFCATLGITVAHFTMKTCLRQMVMSKLTNPSMQATVKVVDSENGSKIVFLSRLTPIPFGLQNALYAMSNIGYFQYIFASIAGMLPSQGMHVYMCTTFRSMEEVLSSSSGTTPATYIIFAVQLSMIVVLFTYVIHRARMELRRLESSMDRENKAEDVVSAMEKGCNGWVPAGTTLKSNNLRQD